eukprot:TRINITY_DN13459_c0_g1_i1.p1 TRINITY_DN13459_c0_g1~~TRINITY_DN13459_c0_g1_i1.p1  ORF type:complete len:214 (+),score=29.73 TRINITY_DN13459_c0_g1_i1:41-643(+)
MRRVLIRIGQSRSGRLQVCRANLSDKSKVMPLIKVTKEEIDSGRGGSRHVERNNNIIIGSVSQNGEVIPEESAFLNIFAVWNTDEKRAELHRRMGEYDLKAWVKGGSYLLGDLDKIDPLSEYWNTEKIDASGGVLVMPHLGRIPGETSKTMTLEEAVAYIGSYDPDAPVDGTLEWKLQEDALKKIQDNFILRGVCLSLPS